MHFIEMKKKTKQVKVFVIDGSGVPCLPTSSARARRLLKTGKAKLYSVEPFTIQLKREIKNPVGKFKIGIDDGAKTVGISVGYKDEVVFSGEIELRQDVLKKCYREVNIVEREEAKIYDIVKLVF